MTNKYRQQRNTEILAFDFAQARMTNENRQRQNTEILAAPE